MKLKRFKYFKLCVIFIAVFVVIPAKVYATSIPSPTQEFYVNDFADVLTDEQEKEMLDKAVNLASEDLGIQIVVTTIKSLNGESIENYAHDMYNQYGIGKDDMGALILLATDDRDTRIELGTAMEAYITDSKAGRLLDKYAIPDFKENRFDSGLVSVQGALIDEASTIKTQMIEKEQREAQTKERLEAIGNFFKGILTVIGYILLFGTPIGIIAFLIYRAYKKHKAKEDELEALRQYKEDSEENIERIKREKERIQDEADRKINQMYSTIDELQSKNVALEKQYEDVQAIHPDIDNELDKYYVKDINKDIDKYSVLKPGISLIAPLASIISEYKKLTYGQRKYVSSDYSKIESMYETSVELKDKEDRRIRNEGILAGIVALIGSIAIGKNSNLSSLKNGLDSYNSLDDKYKEKFGVKNLEKLKTLIAQAEKDHKRILREEEEERERKRREEEEEEERRRRQRLNSYHSSSSSSSSFHGFGGHSSGGGASRHF